MSGEDTCVRCGETRAEARKGTLCGWTISDENGTEGDIYGDGRHRWRPYTEKEIAAKTNEERDYCQQMGEMADFVREQDAAQLEKRGEGKESV